MANIRLNFENLSKSSYSYIYICVWLSFSDGHIHFMKKKCFFVVMTSQCRVLTTLRVHIYWLFFTKKVPAQSCPTEIFFQSNNSNTMHLMLKYFHGAKQRSL